MTYPDIPVTEGEDQAMAELEAKPPACKEWCGRVVDWELCREETCRGTNGGCRCSIACDENGGPVNPPKVAGQ